MSLTYTIVFVVSIAATATVELPSVGFIGPQQVRLQRQPDEEDQIMRWSSPVDPVNGNLADWFRRNATQLTEVQRAWAALERRLRGIHPAEFGAQCDRLTSSLEQLDETLLLPAPDRVVDLYTRSLMVHLHGAARSCRARELFNVVHRLDQARHALAEVLWMVEHRAVGMAGPGPRQR